MKRWIKSVFDVALIVLIVIAAKTAIAEPYYVPSGSMEPTLQIGDELLATKYPYGYSSASLPIFITLPEYRAHPRRAAAARRCRGVSLARRPFADLGQARRRPSRRSHRHAQRTAVDQRRCRSVSSRRYRLVRKRKTAREQPVSRFIETLPGGRQHTIFKEQEFGMLDNMPEVTVAAGPSVRHGRQSRQFGRQPGPGRRRRRRPVAGRRSGRTRRRAGRLVGLGRRGSQPVWDWPSDLRLSRFFTAVQ